MEQLLFESDKKEANRLAEYKFPPSLVSARETYDNLKRNFIFSDGFKAGCIMKNNQMQKFIEWLSISDWACEAIDFYRNVHTNERINFQTIFEMFLKETSK